MKSILFVGFLALLICAQTGAAAQKDLSRKIDSLEAAAKTAATPGERGLALCRACVYIAREGDSARAMETGLKGLRLARQSAAAEDSMLCLANIAQASGALRDFARQADYYMRAAAAAGAGGDKNAQANFLIYAGGAYISLQRWGGAEKAYRKSYKLCESRLQRGSTIKAKRLALPYGKS